MSKKKVQNYCGRAVTWRTVAGQMRYSAEKRTALDGKVWWCIFDHKECKYISGYKYSTRTQCEGLIGGMVRAGELTTDKSDFFEDPNGFKTDMNKGKTDMATSTFAPFKTIKVTCEVDWDLEDEDSPDGDQEGYELDVGLDIYTVELQADKMMEYGLMWVDEGTGKYVIDNDALEDSDYLSDLLSDNSGFCHNGYSVLELSPEAY